MVGMKYVASVSFGKDSLAMLLNLIEKKYPLDEVIFFDTGMEFDCIYRIRDKITSLLKENNVSFVELHPDKPFLFYMLDTLVKYRNKDGYHFGYRWCGSSCRWGTALKTNAISKYKKSQNQPVIDYVGIAYDEPNRFERAKQEGKFLPLVDWKMTEKDCLEYCYSKGYTWEENGVDLYWILDRVSCWCCRNKNLKELKMIYLFLPEYWDKLKYLEEIIKEPFKSNGKSIYDLEMRFMEELKIMNVEFFRGKLMEAMKNKNVIEKECLQILISSIRNKEIEKKSTISEQEIISLIQKEIKQLNETVSIGESGGRDMTDYKAKVQFYSQFIPDQLSENEILEIIGKNCAGMDNKGMVMKKIMPILKGRADGKAISSAVDKFLNK